MSRTYRKRTETFEQYYSHWFANDWFGDEKDEMQMRAKYYNTTDKWYSHSLPKYFRKDVNRKRRKIDRHEIYKAINFDDYPEQCSRWNCKDNNAWGYW